MKKLSLILSVFAFVLASCSGDDNVVVDTNPATTSITGKWYKHKIRDVGSTIWMDELNHGGGCSRPYVEFLANGTYKEVGYENYMGICLREISESQYTRDGRLLDLGEINGMHLEAEIITIENGMLHQKITYTDQSSGYVNEFETLLTRN